LGPKMSSAVICIFRYERWNNICI